MKSLVLLSGGLDSTVSLAQAVKESEVVLVLIFDYGQLAAKPEVEAALKIAEYYSLQSIVLKLPWLKALGSSALTDKKCLIPPITEDDLRCSLEINCKNARAVWVPNRNAVFLNIAAAYAESLACDLIVAGFNAEEAVTFPDNSIQFVNLINQVFKLSTQVKPKVISYTQSFNKIGVVTLGLKLEAPLSLIYSCYRGGVKMCGRCESCSRLRRAFKNSGNWDLIKEKFLETK